MSGYYPPPGYALQGSNRHGAAFELMFAAELILRGAEAALSISHFTGWDLVSLSAKGTFRVNVKHILNRTVTIKVQKAACDVFAVWHGGIWFIFPHEWLGKRHFFKISAVTEWADRWDLLL